MTLLNVLTDPVSIPRWLWIVTLIIIVIDGVRDWLRK